MKALASVGVVTEACRVAGVGTVTAYRHRDNEPDFAVAWEEAVEQAADGLELEARRRAVKGVMEGKSRRYSDTLLIFLLKGARPEKYRDMDIKRLAEVLAEKLQNQTGRLAPPEPGPAPGGQVGDGPAG